VVFIFAAVFLSSAELNSGVLSTLPLETAEALRFKSDMLLGRGEQHRPSHTQ